MKTVILIVLVLLFYKNRIAQKNRNNTILSVANKVFDRVYFGDLNDMIMYRYETINYLLSDKSEKNLLSGFVKATIGINNKTRTIVQNEYMYVSGKMNMNLNTPQIGIRKYF